MYESAHFWTQLCVCVCLVVVFAHDGIFTHSLSFHLSFESFYQSLCLHLSLSFPSSSLRFFSVFLLHPSYIYLSPFLLSYRGSTVQTCTAAAVVFLLSDIIPPFRMAGCVPLSLHSSHSSFPLASHPPPPTYDQTWWKLFYFYVSLCSPPCSLATSLALKARGLVSPQSSSLPVVQ